LRYAACEQTCNLCGKVCPTQAIRDLDLEEKKHARIGTAVILKEKCLVWEQDKVCLICDEQCPYNAIVFKTVDGHRRPFIIENKCNGCGLCEHKCPIEGESAIVVKPIGEMRLKEGSYIEEAGRLDLSLKEEEGYDRFLFENEQADE
jgi:NAD-dependent dihydropyrimidine dehydrogenase PreA subunit